MTEGSMTGRPYGGTNDSSNEDGLPGEVSEKDQVGAAPQQSPRAAQGEMTDDGAGVPGAGTSPNAAGPPDAGTR